jgi:cytochrome c biogenesis protein CcdA
MLRLIGLVVSIGLADSLNPTTIAPALYLASGEHPRSRVTEYTLAVFFVYLAGGALIALGPGQLLLSLVPRPDAEDRHVLAIIAGAMMIVAAAVLWHNRGRLSEYPLPDSTTKGKSSAILGATITAVELPTAFPYFAAITAIVGSGFGPARQLLLLVLFNVCFVLPLLGIVGTLWLRGDQADRMLSIGRDFLQRHWPVVLAGLALLAGVFVTLLGITGLTARGHGRFGRLMQRVHHLLHP